jgi:hypothetical protein
MQTLDLAYQTGPIAVTLAYLLLYYAFMVNVLRLKTTLAAEYKAKGEKFDRYFGEDRRMLAADRIQLNMLEHMAPFLVLMWVHAIFVSPVGATIAGGIYVAARAIYPFLIGGRVGRGVRGQVMFSTGTGYGVLLYLFGAIVYTMVAG